MGHSFQIGEPFIPSRKESGFWAPDIVGKQTTLSEGEKRLYERLARYCGRKEECWPGQAQLAADLGRTERTIRRDLDGLEAGGWIRRAVRGNGRGASTRTVYQLLFRVEFSAVTTGQIDTYDRTSEDLRPDIHGVTTGHPRSYDRTSTVTRIRNRKASGISSEAAAAAAITSPPELTPEEATVEATCYDLGVDMKPGAASALVERAVELGGTVQDLLIVITEQCRARARARAPIRTGEFLLTVIGERLKLYLRRARSITAPDPRQEQLWPEIAMDLWQPAVEASIPIPADNSPSKPVEKPEQCRRCRGEGVVFDGPGATADMDWCKCAAGDAKRATHPRLVDEWRAEREAWQRRTQIPSRVSRRACQYTSPRGKIVSAGG